MKRSGLETRRFFNSSGKVYREMNLKEKAPSMDKKEAARLISENPMLLKRPLLLDEDKVLLGFSLENYKSLIEI